jgi:tRNA(adenine34) deaminase
MQEALKQAKLANKLQEVPVGAVVVSDSKIIATGHNTNISTHSVVNHAEINAINQASAFLQNHRLVNCDIYVTLEPCHMCAKAIVDARFSNLYFGTPEPKSGAIISIDNFLEKEFLNHTVCYEYGMLQDECRQLMKMFFSSRRH